MKRDKKQKIIELRNKGYTYDQIQDELKCSKGTISYHCGDGQKEKTKNRSNKDWKNLIRKKIDVFNRKHFAKIKKIINSKYIYLINSKICFFNKGKNQVNNLTLEQFLEKYKDEEVRCYLTGEIIDITKPRTYHFDHKIPISRGGDNSINNLGICTKKANQAKSDMTPEEFYELCEKILKYRNQILHEEIASSPTL